MYIGRYIIYAIFVAAILGGSVWLIDNIILFIKLKRFKKGSSK
jgi:hypothetical protein